MHQNLLNHKSAQFATERDTSSILFEVKKTRAIWDSGLSVPGTNRRGGWRCPPGLAFGGQITDRFGRNCGYGLVRRLGNAMNDLGERMNEGDKKRRERRIAKLGANINQPGMVERAAGRVADALETDKKPARRVRTGNIDAVKPVKPLKPVAPVARVAKGDLKKPVAVDTVSNTPVPAGAPNIGETLNEYKRRKYNEHQKRVREIRQGGGKAGMLRYPEWDKFHGSVIEENWNKNNGIPRARKRVINKPKPKGKIEAAAEPKKPVKPRAPKAKIADAKKEVTAEKPAVKKAAAKKPAAKKPVVKKAKATPPLSRFWGDKLRLSLENNGMFSDAELEQIMKIRKDEEDDIKRTLKNLADRGVDAAEKYQERLNELEQGVISARQFADWKNVFSGGIEEGKDILHSRLTALIEEVQGDNNSIKVDKIVKELILAQKSQIPNIVIANLAKNEKSKPVAKDATNWGDKMLKSLDNDNVLSATNIASLMKRANIEQSIIDATVKKQLDREADAVKQFGMRQKQLEDGLITPSEYEKWVDTFIQDIAPVKDGIKDRLNSFIKEVEDNKDQDEIKRKLERLLTGNRLQVANVVVADLAKKFNAAQQAKKPVESLDSAPSAPKAANAGKNLAKVLRVAGVRKHGKEGKIAVGDGLPPKAGELPVPHIVNSKMTSSEAIAHLKNGGDLAVVPHHLWFQAIQANLKTPNNPNGTWGTLAKKGGNIGDTHIFVKLDANGNKTSSGWVFKAASSEDNLHELMAWNLAGAHGFDIEGAHMDGQIGGRNSVVLPFAQHHIPADWKQIQGNGNNFDKDAIDSLDDKAYPQRVAHYLHNYILNVRDRHTGNGFAKVYAKPSGEKVAHIIPIDQGWAFKKGYNPPASIREYGFDMDSNLLERVKRHLGQIPDKKEQAKQRQAVVDAMDGIIENAQKVMKMDSNEVHKWVKSMYPEGQDVSKTQVARFWTNYNKMVNQLINERADIIAKIGG